MEKNFKINQIILFLFLIFLLSFNLSSSNEILLHEFYEGDYQNNIEFVEYFRNFFAQENKINSYLEISYIIDNYKLNFKETDKYENANWDTRRNLPEKFNLIIGDRYMGLNFTLGSFFPIYRKNIEFNQEKEVRISTNIGEGIRYYQFYAYYSLSKSINIGAGYGKVFGENKISKTTQIGNQKTFKYIDESISGNYKYLYLEIIPVNNIQLFGFIPFNINGSYTKEVNQEGIETQYIDNSLFISIPYSIGAEIDFKSLRLYGNYRFTNNNIYLSNSESEIEFKGINNDKWDIYEIGSKILLSYPFIKLINLSFQKENYFILDRESKSPSLYSLKFKTIFNIKDIFFKISYRFIFGKAYFSFKEDYPLVNMSGNKISFSLGFYL